MNMMMNPQYSEHQYHSYLYTLYLSLLLLVSCMETSIKPEPDLLIVSLIDLLSSPAKYDGRKVQVKGYLLNGHLYLSKDHALVSHDIALSVPFIEPTENGKMILSCNDAYSSVEGVFMIRGSSWKNGTGVIDLVEKVSLFKPSLETCWEK